MRGEVQGAQEAESSLQAKVEPVSVEVKEKLAAVSVVEAGGEAVIEVLGAVVSGGSTTVQLSVAGEASVLPAASVARTEKLWAPRAREL